MVKCRNEQKLELNKTGNYMQQVTFEADHAVQFRQKNYSPLTLIMLSLAYTT